MSLMNYKKVNEANFNLIYIRSTPTNLHNFFIKAVYQ